MILLVFLIALVYPIFGGYKIFFCHERIGLNGKEFTLYKIRTLRENRSGHLKNIYEDELENIRKEVKEFVKQSKKEAWSEYQDPLKSELNELFSILKSISSQCNINELDGWISDLKQSWSF